MCVCVCGGGGLKGKREVCNLLKRMYILSNEVV